MIHTFTFTDWLYRGRNEREYEVEVTYTITPGCPARLYGDYPHPAETDEIEIVSIRHNGSEFNTTREEENHLLDRAYERDDLVVPLLNEAHGMTLDEDDLHDITRDKLKLWNEIPLPSGEVHRKRKSTSNRAMNEADRAEFTTKALVLWSTWVGVDVTTLRHEAECLAA